MWILVLVVLLMGVIVFFHALSTKQYKPKIDTSKLGSLPKGYYYRDALWDT